MRKLMVLAAMLAMMMVAAAPAYAQDAFAVSGEGDATATGGDVTVVDASQTATVDVSQVQTGDATAVADDGSLSFASVDSSLDVTVNQVNGGFGDGFFLSRRAEVGPGSPLRPSPRCRGGA